MKPTFYIIGAPKCGTTSWAAYLAEHPMVHISDPKEPNYFSTDLRTESNDIIKNIDDYEMLFQRPVGVRQAGEATPLYLYSTKAVANIATYTPEAKIIILLREPVSFFRSLHQQFLYRRIETNPNQRQVWDLSGTRRFPDHPHETAMARHLDYKAIGDFKAQFDRVLEHFPPEQVFLAWMEDWKNNPQWLYEEIARFIQIDPAFALSFEVHNSAKRHRLALISKFTIRPPKPLVKTAGIVRRFLGLKRLGIAPKLRALNTSHNVAKGVSESLAQEIRDFYAQDYEALNIRAKELGILRRREQE